MSNKKGSIEEAAAAAGIGYYDAAVLQGAHTALLVAVARGDVDLNAMARRELANRGLDRGGQWIGFAQADRQAGTIR